MIQATPFQLIGSKKEHIRIHNFTRLGSDEANLIRNEIANCLRADYAGIYIDAKDVDEADLCGINEIIHINYTLRNQLIDLVLVYRKMTQLEKWVDRTRLDEFVETAILPARVTTN